MTGWKTWTAGLISIINGLAMIVYEFYNSFVNAIPVDAAAMTEGIAFVSAGLAAIGLGHKLEKSPK